VAFQLCAVTAATAWATGAWRASLVNAAQIVALGAVFLAPWLLLYSPYYLTALSHPIHTLPADIAMADQGIEPIATGSEMRNWHDLLRLVSPGSTFYGASVLAYTCLAAGLILCALFVRPGDSTDRVALRCRLELVAGVAAAAAAYLFWVIVGPRMQEFVNTLRYSIPVLIGSVSAALPLAAVVAKRRAGTVCVTVAVLLLVLFAPATRQRAGTLLHQRSQLAYLHHWERWRLNRNLEFQRRAFNGEARSEVQHLQEKVPPGQMFLAWTAMPFLFDFSRNIVLDANIAGLAQPWGRIPVIRYIIWHHSGYAAAHEDAMRHDIARFGRRTAQLDLAALDVLHWLQYVRRNAKVLGDQDGIVVMQVDENTSPPDADIQAFR
jgi:hypothetical protein